MAHNFTIQIGDPSRDGHGKSDDFTITSNKSCDEVEESYMRTCSRLGVQLHGHHSPKGAVPFSDYGDYKVGLDWFEKAGLDPDELELASGSRNDDKLAFSSEDLIELFILFVTTHDPSIEMEVSYDDLETFCFSMGYGLFD